MVDTTEARRLADQLNAGDPTQVGDRQRTVQDRAVNMLRALADAVDAAPASDSYDCSCPSCPECGGCARQCSHDPQSPVDTTEAPAPDSAAVTATAEALRQHLDTLIPLTQEDWDEDADGLSRDFATIAVRALRDHDRTAGLVTVDADDLWLALETSGHTADCPGRPGTRGICKCRRPALDRLRGALGGES